MNVVDRFICEIDNGLRTVFAPAHAARVLPVATAGAHTRTDDPSAPITRVASIRLMRVNHTGEVCAQALYQGQALVAREPATRALLDAAANEERDHLSWCAQRLTALGGATSMANPVFYAGSFALGVASGLMGDKWSMGFLVETERQVEAHLEGHLGQIPADDLASRAIIEAMQADEIKHAQSGEAHGGVPLPGPVKAFMRAGSRVMTTTSYWI